MLMICYSCMERADVKLLHGQWKGVQWLVEGLPGEFDPSTTVFDFQPDGMYTYSYNDAVETGKYFVSNNELFTTPDGGVKMMVKIEKLTADSLVFRMNRGGQAETLKLIRN
jgi:Lipocalin-like domain